MTAAVRKALAGLLRKELEEAESRARDARVEAEYYTKYLKLTGRADVWGADARKAKRALPKASREVADLRRAIADLDGKASAKP